MPFESDLSYFINSKPNILGNPNLREPQISAYLYTYNHFIKESKTSDALILLPTGVGKTGLMGLLPYDISSGRVLIITPQLIIKDVVLNELDPNNPQNFWIERKIFKSPQQLPTVIEYGTDTSLEVLNAANLVILNVHKLQTRLDSSLIRKVPADFFDMIIIDEAHHSVANTWVEAMHYFSNAKIVKLTGTPFRPDNKQICGDLIYRYKLSQAMSNSYIKSLKKFEYVPGEITFTMDGSDKEFTYNEVMELKDEDWISSSVALSIDCTKNVVRESIQLLKGKSKESDIPHKIIAVACNISHANIIKQLYDSEGCAAAIIHSNMSRSEINAAKLDIENNRVNVIVEVAMLGEGYDHKYLSIAAIFRPFKSLLAYEQFIGRILRYIPEAKKPDDNIGAVVVHKYLHLDELWDHYKREIDESEIIKSLTDIEKLYDNNISDGDSDKLVPNYGKVAERGAAVLVEEPYMATELIKLHKQEVEANEKKIKGLMDTLKIRRDEAERILHDVSVRSNPIKRPDLYFASRRKEIDVKIREQIVPELLLEFSIDKEGVDLKQFSIFQNSEYSWIAKQKNNAAMLAVYFNAYLKNTVGDRNNWAIDDYDIADGKLDKCVEYVRLKLQEIY